jgi:hypothetical protein
VSYRRSLSKQLTRRCSSPYLKSHINHDNIDDAFWSVQMPIHLIYACIVPLNLGIVVHGQFAMFLT